MATNIIVAKFCADQTRAWTDELWQYDYGQVLKFDGLELPVAYEVHFANQPHGVNSTTQIGNADGVTIPDQFLQSGEVVYAWVYLHAGEDDGETEYMVTIPVSKRAKPTNQTPTPVQQDAITEAIAALNAAVEDADELAREWENMSATAETLPEGSAATALYSEGTLTLGIPRGDTGAQGIPGQDGEDGAPGAPGEDGFSPEITVQDITGGHRITITDATGTKTVNVMDGEDGQPGQQGAAGNGIASITKTGTVGLVDTYTITYTNGTTTTFTVTNGSDATVTVDDALSSTSENPVQNKVINSALSDLSDDINQLSETGIIVGETAYSYYSLASGQLNNNYTDPVEETVVSSANTGYIIIQKNQVPTEIRFDTAKYKVNVVFVKNGYQINGTYTSWITRSPLPYAEPSDWDALGINVRKLSGNFTTAELAEALYKTETPVIGNLATKDYVGEKIKGTKVIYPDGFTSRIMPDIYYNGSYYADITADDYKISGGGSIWVSVDGNDTTGDGSENNPYLTITKALTFSARTIHIKEGTYEQGTHYASGTDFKGRNVIGHGTVVLQNNSSGGYSYVTENAYIENIVFKHGSETTNPAFVASSGSLTGQTVCFVGCTFRDGGTNGLAVTGIDAVLINCIAFGNKQDGFNYHKNINSGIIPNVLEINCTAYNNGPNSDSSNGSTAHDGAKIVRVNGEYYSCHGGVIAEIGLDDENADPTESVNFAVIAHDSTGTNEYAASFWASFNTKMYLYDCISYGSTYDISAINDAEVFVQGLKHKWGNITINKSEKAKVVSIPDGVDSQFRVIKTITLTEDTLRLYVNTDSDGNAFSLKDVVIDFNLTASTGSGVCGIFLNTPDQGSISGATVPNLCANGVFATSANRRYAKMSVIGGKLFGESTNSSNANWYGTSALITSKNAMGTFDCQSIKSINMYSLNNYMFASGSEITIYGR